MTVPMPPGWYDTGVPGEQGWWDGMQWTPHRRAVPLTAPPVTDSSWGRGNPVASLVVGIVVALIAATVGLSCVVLTFLGAGPGLVFATSVTFVGLAALAVIAIVNASVGFRRRWGVPPTS